MINSSIFLMLREFDILKSLSERELEEMTKLAQLKRVEKNMNIYEPGDESHFVYLVQKGSVKLGINAACGKILIKDVIYENSLFGENIFVGEGLRKEFAKTMTDTSVIKIPTEVFRKMVDFDNLNLISKNLIRNFWFFGGPSLVGMDQFSLGA